jgi:hypothetical protein
VHDSRKAQADGTRRVERLQHQHDQQCKPQRVSLPDDRYDTDESGRTALPNRWTPGGNLT